MTGSIIFSMVETKTDITYAMSVVSHFAKNLSHLYSKLNKTFFHYLKTTNDVGITYGGEYGRDITIREYFNSHWAGNHVIK